MNKNEPNEIKRNTPSQKGTNNDPYIRDESAQKPGTSTMSSSNTDDHNNELTKTASDDFDANITDERADKTFDEVDGHGNI